MAVNPSDLEVDLAQREEATMKDWFRVATMVIIVLSLICLACATTNNRVLIATGEQKTCWIIDPVSGDVWCCYGVQLSYIGNLDYVKIVPPPRNPIEKRLK